MAFGDEVVAHQHGQGSGADASETFTAQATAGSLLVYCLSVD